MQREHDGTGNSSSDFLMRTSMRDCAHAWLGKGPGQTATEGILVMLI